MAKPKETLEIDKDSVLILCAVRYALGRQSYMPSMVVNEILPLLPLISDRNLKVMQKDLWDYLKTENEYKRDWNLSYWNNLYDAVKAENVRRNGELINGR